MKPTDLASRLGEAPFVKFFFAIASPRAEFCHEVHRDIERAYGPLTKPSPVYRFSDFSRYYDEEFQGPTWKYLIGLEALYPADELVAIKLFCEQIQIALSSSSGRRTVNLDPGLVNGWQVVLSTVKNHAHRIYLHSGVFAEVTLWYRSGQFEPLPWTYPDFLSEPVSDYLTGLRSDYIRQKRTSPGH